MVIAKTIPRVRQEIARAKTKGKKIGFVPTMGALHQGHLSLILKAKKECDYVVASIFVNPLQFGKGEDLKRYPRNLSRDLRLLYNEHVDMVFYPNAKMMYSKDASTYVEETDLSKRLCGKFRPGHFKGVCTVVAKLFNIVSPDTTYFGRKDYQQAKIIERMVHDLAFPVKIKIAPIVREKTGLAMSSRNEYLSGESRKKAAGIYKALQNAKYSCRKKVTSGRLTRQIKKDIITSIPTAKIQYIEIVDPETLKPLKSIKSRALIAVAVYVEKVRLIDNIIV
ncbi:MAG: pantoate--beta-alanine ligase [Candidatus Omnitrophica bacterium]|nr:pantoate--beta-alanine ligase [Candidatus Omnitrophota bacterium]